MRAQSLPNIIRSAMQSALSKKKKHHVEASTYVIIMKRLKTTDWPHCSAHLDLCCRSQHNFDEGPLRRSPMFLQCSTGHRTNLDQVGEHPDGVRQKKKPKF